MESQIQFTEAVPLATVAENLSQDLPLLRTKFSEKQEHIGLNSEELSLQQAIDSPAPFAMLRGLQEAGVETLNLEGVSTDTAVERVQGILSRGYETFQDYDLPTPNLNIYYEAQALSQASGQSINEALEDIELARSLQIDGAELAPAETDFSISPSEDVVFAPEGVESQVEFTEPENYVDIEVISIGRELGDIPLYGEYGHAALLLYNTETGEGRISSAFPVEDYPGGVWGGIRDQAFDNSHLTPFGPAEAAAMEGVAGGDFRHFEVIERDVVRGDWDEINSRLDKFNTFIDEQDIPYRPRSNNSNTFEGDAREIVTGKDPENETDRGYPGRDNDMMDYEGTEFEAYFD